MVGIARETSMPYKEVKSTDSDSDRRVNLSPGAASDNIVSSF